MQANFHALRSGKRQSENYTGCLARYQNLRGQNFFSH